MPVTELACLHLKTNEPLSSPINAAVIPTLQAGLRAQASYTNRAVHLLTQIEDPSYIYILGEWDSVEQHMQGWIPSATNQDIMGTLKDDVEVVWLQHVDFESWTSKGIGSGDMPYNAAVVAIGRYFGSSGDKQRFEQAFTEMKEYIKTLDGPGEVCGGWRVDQEDGDREEFVVLSGSGSDEELLAFANGAAGQVKDFLKGTEVKHASWMLAA
ncbi:hypothetical protein BJX61DRAFT_511020 [Aspergillus egyptiacus]|nr:hypothetical protein BJX61DRAFT_511020 [Aspergillus egyptiacus]